MEMRADLLIVGAGMVGSALALALQDSGLEVMLLDGSPLSVKPFDAEAAFEPRVSALSAASQRILERLGVWDGIAQRRSSPYTDMHVWDGSGTGQIHFSASSVHADVLGHIVENRVVQDALLERLHDCDLGMLANARLEQMRRSGDDWLLTLADGRTLRAPLVIAADGANSAVRRLTGVATREWDYLHHAIVTSVRCSQPHRKTAWQRFTDHGPLAFLPLERDGQQDWCSIVWSTTPAEAERLMALEEAAFCAELERAFEGRLGEVISADPRLCVPLRQRHAKRYVAEGLALIGDAAHTIHPLAGQGVNLGYRDVDALLDVLGKARAHAEAWSSLGVLKRYQTRRMADNFIMQSGMDLFYAGFSNDLGPVRILRNIGLMAAERAGGLKRQALKYALGL